MRNAIGIVYDLDHRIAATRAADDGRVRVIWREPMDAAQRTASREQFVDVEDAVAFLTKASIRFGVPISDAEQQARNVRHAEQMKLLRAR